MTEFTPDLLHRLVSELDRAADRLLRAHLGITFRRAIFLFTLERRGTVTQHELAAALGYSDPAVSTMLKELRANGLVSSADSPEHGRKRLVSVTSEGRSIVRRGRALLAAEFGALMTLAGVSEEEYGMLTARILNVLLDTTETTGTSDIRGRKAGKAKGAKLREVGRPTSRRMAR